tara:strand:- start:65 stop:346 length:282 start_codon:yes stop_codon:yes gene_type:complete
MATNNALLLGGVVVVGLWWWKKNNGAGFKPVQRSTGLTGSPTNFTISNIETDNWFSKLLTSTPAIMDAGPSRKPAPPSSYAIGQMRQTGNWHL